MLKPSLVVVAVVCGVLSAKGAGAVWGSVEKSFAGSYAIYGGSPNAKEAREPRAGDTKVAFSLRGSAAKQIFEAIGPGRADSAPAEQACPAHPNILVRQRDALICRRSPGEQYWCTFGFDLSTGLSTWGVIGGAICAEGTSTDRPNS